jgi:hypothetical protein
MSDHDVVVSRIKEAFQKKGFPVQTEGNNLPHGAKLTEAIYRPDMIVRSKGSDDVAWIVEVETSEAGKSVVGAAVLADVCMQIETERGRQRERPNLLFIFHRPSANLQLAEKRFEQLKRQHRLEHLAGVSILTERQAVEEIQCL